MKKLNLLIAVGFTVSNSFAQTFDYLTTGSIKARVDSKGNLFNGLSGGPGFEAPVGSGNSTIISSSLWIAGTDAGSNLHLSADPGDFQYGPLLEDVATTSTIPSIWNKVWKVTAADVSYHIANYMTSGYVLSPAIATWPAHGNSAYGEPYHVAPFFDYNGDNYYDPMAGDYPLIKGTQCIFQVYNDKIVHASGGEPIGVEIQCMAYVFECLDSALANTVFVNYRIINKSTATYYDTYMSLWSDPDIGYGINDYAGSDVSRGLIYAYNGSTSDASYDSILPAQGMTVLGGPFLDTDGIDNQIYSSYATAIANNGIPYSDLGYGYNDVIVDNERMGLRNSMYYMGAGAPHANMSDPTTAPQYYNYMRGLWRDGSSLFYGGNGYPGQPGVTATQANYAFFKDTDPIYWATSGTSVTPDWDEGLFPNLPSDRRMTGSMGPLTLMAGVSNEIDVAYTFARDYTQFHQTLAALPLLQQRVDSLHSYFNANMTPCGSFTYSTIAENMQESIQFNVYPNPASNQLSISINNQAKGMYYSLYDVLGNAVMNGDINSNKTLVDVSGISEGIYILEVTNGTEKSSKRIVVNR